GARRPQLPGGARAVAGSRSGRRGTGTLQDGRWPETPAAPVRVPDVQAQPKGRTRLVSTTSATVSKVSRRRGNRTTAQGRRVKLEPGMARSAFRGAPAGRCSTLSAP